MISRQGRPHFLTLLPAVILTIFKPHYFMTFLRNIWNFIKSRRFLAHLGIYIVSVLLLLWIVFKWLDVHTGHGDFVEVPDFNGVRIPDLKEFSANFGLRDTIIDSVYDNSKPHGVVVSQDPEPKSKVKHNRMIYLYVNSYLPQSVVMPDLVDPSKPAFSPRQAVQMLSSYGLKVKTVTEAGQNYVHKQSIPPGKVIPKGTLVIITVGTGEGEEKETVVPGLIGLSHEEALNALSENNLEEGGVVCEGCKTSADSLKAVVYRQSPAKGESVSSGSSVNIFLTLDPARVPEVVTPTTSTSGNR
jgi:beta-lactam-binding protein with PASTA domain